MATTVSLFCAHKRLKTACPACQPDAQRPSALRDDDAPVARRRRG